MAPKSPHAAVLIIGNEILSGRTQDVNIQHLAEKLGLRGITLAEVRIVRDDESAIIQAVRALSSAYNLVFTTGGIGPTHDDITADCMAKAFDVPLEINKEAKDMLASYCATRGVPLNDGRLRMARIPRGARLIKNNISAAPGFQIKNVYVMAGVPSIMQDMLKSIEPSLPQGEIVYSHTVLCDLREGDIALALEEIQNRYADIEIGSYPSMMNGKPRLSLVLRGAKIADLEEALYQIEKMVRALSNSACTERDTRIPGI